LNARLPIVPPVKSLIELQDIKQTDSITGKGKVMKKLYIGNCDHSLDETTLQGFMETSGVQVSSVRIIRDRDTGQSRGFGFAELSDSQDLQGAIDALNGKEVAGRALTVNEAREQQPRRNNRNSRW
jgi:cold-inducible RNA-binding protein